MNSNAAHIVPSTLSICEDIYKETKYENNAEAEITFKSISTRLPIIVTSDREAGSMATKFCSLSRAVGTKESFLDMVKIIWRMAKSKTGQPQYKLCLLIVGVAAMTITVRKNHPRDVDDWLNKTTKWLGTQLTIGGKGVVGEGQGGVVERMSNFFQTPYLHDFD